MIVFLNILLKILNVISIAVLIFFFSLDCLESFMSQKEFKKLLRKLHFEKYLDYSIEDKSGAILFFVFVAVGTLLLITYPPDFLTPK